MDIKKSKYRTLQNILEKMDRVAVAFSGGVDSTFLLRTARDTLGDRVMAVTALSETVPRHESDDIRNFVRELGVLHRLVETRELDLPEFVLNKPDRCYVCKKYRFGKLIALAQAEGFSIMADGENIDDEDDFRPGRRAVRELGVRSPLREAGFTKADIREMAKKMGLANWDRPASACLASRIPFYIPVTAELLDRIDRAETFLRSLNICPQVRVRLGTGDPDTARIEVFPEAFSRLTAPEVRQPMVTFLKNLGFRYITIDLEGYRVGSLNPEIRKDEPDGQ